MCCQSMNWKSKHIFLGGTNISHLYGRFLIVNQNLIYFHLCVLKVRIRNQNKIF